LAKPVTFISYAQNYEDVMLWRALKHVGVGFYIDAGAAHPDEISVTRAFYDRGWHGINIEPSLPFFRRLAGARMRDINLNIALAAQPGQLPFFEVEGTGLSTIDQDIADEHTAAGWPVHETIVQVRTLAELCREHVTNDVHFLKIDVEGAEAAVLAGADFNICRPWIVIVEATRPMSQEQNHLEWESFLTSAGYRSVYFDGLNRFYVAAERWEDLSQVFAVPPNVFDDFIRAPDSEHLQRMIAAEERVARAEVRASQAEACLSQAELRASQAEGRFAAANAEIVALRASISWRLTAPFRGIGHLVRR
jgi:FkbM family methyltransferase